MTAKKVLKEIKSDQEYYKNKREEKNQARMENAKIRARSYKKSMKSTRQPSPNKSTGQIYGSYQTEEQVQNIRWLNKND